PNHPGTAFLELQFYPPGWIPWPTWAVALGASTCDPVRWCAAMNVFSLQEDPVAGTFNNDDCLAKVGIETFQFAFVTKNGGGAAERTTVRFSNDTGHFRYCNGVAVPATPFGLDSSGNPIVCPDGNTEEIGANQEPTDGDRFCFPASEALRYKVQGCTDTGVG